MGTEVLIRGRVSRKLPQPNMDGMRDGDPVRVSRYSEQTVMSPITKKHMLADEGSYWTATMLPEATALQLGLSAAFAATAAAIVIQNTDTPGKSDAKRVYLDYIRMIVSVAPTSAAHWKMGTVIDSKDRTPTTISSGTGGTGPGTPATVTAYRAPVFGPNMDEDSPSIVIPYFPLSTAGGAPPTVPSAGTAARTICGQALIRGQIPVVLDQYQIDFGGDVPSGQLVTAAPAGASNVVVSHPPVVIGPGQFFLLYMWGTGNITAGLALSGLDIGGWVR